MSGFSPSDPLQRRIPQQDPQASAGALHDRSGRSAHREESQGVQHQSRECHEPHGDADADDGHQHAHGAPGLGIEGQGA